MLLLSCTLCVCAASESASSHTQLLIRSAGQQQEQIFQLLVWQEGFERTLHHTVAQVLTELMALHAGRQLISVDEFW